MNPTWEQRLAHRLPPAQPFVMHQRWHHLLFLHWRFDAAVIQATLPPGLVVDTFDGSAWVAIVPFFMRGIRPRFTPNVPGISNFLEANVRTYVHDARGRSGVWFYSLDCNQPLAVWTARTFFSLPYHHARMCATHAPDGTIHYRSHRQRAPAGSLFTYRIDSPTHPAEPGTLEFFLAERYLLFSSTVRGLRVGQVFHTPYPLASVQVPQWDAQLIALAGLPAPERPPDHLIASPGVNVRVYPLVPSTYLFHESYPCHHLRVRVFCHRSGTRL
ncbi:MAG TPA: DUF2071 domain-containing protein [Prosthecobacter sp.]|nr:DUF2071 domain-containing protein [Prosthecobacter sp.]